MLTKFLLLILVLCNQIAICDVLLMHAHVVHIPLKTKTIFVTHYKVISPFFFKFCTLYIYVFNFIVIFLLIAIVNRFFKIFYYCLCKWRAPLKAALAEGIPSLNIYNNNNGNFHSYILKYIQSRIISITKLCSKLSITGH